VLALIERPMSGRWMSLNHFFICYIQLQGEEGAMTNCGGLPPNKVSLRLDFFRHTNKHRCENFPMEECVVEEGSSKGGFFCVVGSARENTHFG
jgi:hypothetical protein